MFTCSAHHFGLSWTFYKWRHNRYYKIAWSCATTFKLYFIELNSGLVFCCCWHFEGKFWRSSSILNNFFRCLQFYDISTYKSSFIPHFVLNGGCSAKCTVCCCHTWPRGETRREGPLWLYYIIWLDHPPTRHGNGL